MLVDSAALLRRIAGRRVIASISGGKDSAAMSLYLTELGIEHDRVFLDTGWEHPRTYDYLRGELARVIGPIVELQPIIEAPPPAIMQRLRPRVRAAIEANSAMVKLILRKGVFPARTIRFCTQVLKVKSMQVYIAERVALGDDVLNTVGIRAEESAARAQLAEWEWSPGFDCEVWRPLHATTADEVIALHRRHGLLPNPLYLDGASRVGCWPCIHARKGEIRFIADHDPERILLLSDLEHDVTMLARERIEARGEVMENPPAFFQAPLGRKKDAEGKTIHVGTCWPIERVVAWSRTSRGGRQFELFAPAPSDAGCVRWGLCETGNDAD